MRKTLAAALVAALSTTALTPLMAEVPNDATVLALAARADNNSFDRAELVQGNQIQFWQPVFDTLLTEGPNGEISPNLATAWSYNDDNTVLTLTLREGVSFTDGTPFNAAAVQANMQYLAAGTGQNGYMTRPISEYEIVSDHEIRLYLSEPMPSLITALAVAGGAMASPATLGQPGSDVAPIGSGPYIYSADESVQGAQYVYRRNPDYWNPSAYPYDTVTITPMSDTVARINAMVAGQIDGAVADTRAIPQAEANGLQVNSTGVNWAGIILGDRDGTIQPALADVRVRQAINMAFDAPSILQYIDLGYGSLTDQIFPDSSPAHVAELDDVYPYDPARARELMAEAGYANGFTLVMPEIRPFVAYQPIIAQQLAEIGITVEFEAQAPGSILPVLRQGRYAAYFFTFGSHDPWTDINQQLAPNAAWNSFHTETPEMDAMIHDAQYSSGEAQTAACQAINRYVVDNAWFAVWYRRNSIYFTGADTDVDMQFDNEAPYISAYHPHM